MTLFSSCACDITASSDGLGSGSFFGPDAVTPVNVFDGSLIRDAFRKGQRSLRNIRRPARDANKASNVPVTTKHATPQRENASD